jgi:dolichol-phosphate mannosyltransferase
MYAFVNGEHRTKLMGINERVGIGLEEFTTSGKTFSTRDSAGKIRVGQMMETKFQGEPKVAIVLPTYCEAENIENLIQELQKLKLNLLISVIDDSSPDGTAEIVEKLQEKYGNIILSIRPQKLGLGTAIITAFRSILSLKEQTDYIITMDADYSHNPQDIPRLIDVARSGYDLVIGSRYCEDGRIVGWHRMRWLISRVANLIASAIVGTRIRDCTSGLRCYSKRYVKSVLPNLHSQTYEIQIETVKQAWLQGFRVREVPITFENRKRGKSKLTRTEVQCFLSYVIRSKIEGISF